MFQQNFQNLQKFKKLKESEISKIKKRNGICCHSQNLKK